MPALQNIKNVIVGLTEEGQRDETSDAIGYGHGRLREMVLGGVTQDILRHAPTCSLLSH